MLRIAICDDDMEIYHNIVELLGNLDFGLVLDREIVCTNDDYYDNGDDFLKNIKDKAYDVVFMDIELGKEKGINIVQEMQKETFKPKVIFISSHDEYFRDMAEVGLFSFIQKPLTVDAFEKVMKKLFKAIDDETEMFVITHNKKKLKVPLDKIIYFEKCARKTLIVTEDVKYELSSTLKKVMEQLSSERFFSPNNSFSINYNHIEQFKIEEIEMTNGKIIPVAERRRKEIRSLYFSMRKEKCLL